MLSRLTVSLLSLFFIAKSTQASGRMLFSEEELRLADHYKSERFLAKKRADELTRRSQLFFSYVLKQNRKAAAKKYALEMKRGSAKILERYVPEFDLRYLIRKERIKELKRYE